MFEPYSYNLYSPYNNPYFQQSQPNQIPRQPQQTIYKPQNIIPLQGKVVDSLDVVKATDIPYDGVVYDTFDCRDRFLWNVWRVE